MNCHCCDQVITPAAWCRMRRDKNPSLWTAKQAAEQCGCPTNTMGAALAKHFPKREIRLGPDINHGKKCALYCVWPEASDAFFKTKPTHKLRDEWREQNRLRREFSSLLTEFAAEHV